LDLRHVQPDVLRQHVAQPGHDFLGLPALPLKVDDVGLHEHRATVAELRESLGAESHVGELLHRVAEPLRRGLQEVAVAGRALRVQLEILNAAVLQNDDLDVLAADVADDVDVVIKVEAGLGVGDGFDDGGVGARHVAQYVFRVAGGAHAEYFERGALLLHLRFQLSEDVDRVFNRIALGKLISLGQQPAFRIVGQKHGLGGSRSTVDPNEPFNHLTRPEWSGNNFL
jgi:hypothetical protein